MNNSEAIEFRLIEILNSKYQSLRSWKALEELIADNNPDGVTVDRRKLKRLCESKDESVTLTIAELRAIETILDHEDSMCHQPIFIKHVDNLMNSFRDLRKLVIFLGSKYSEEIRSDYVSTWDLRAHKNITEVAELDHMRIYIKEIFHRKDHVERIRKDGWERLLKDQNLSVIAIGSPYINHGTEWMISSIFRRTPYEPTAMEKHKPTLPCYLIWPDEQSRLYIKSSALQMELAYLEKHFKAQYTKQGMDGTKRAFLIGENLYVSKRIGENHGLVIAQRQSQKGNIFLALCGTYGPTTHAMSKYLAKGELTHSLPKFDDSKKVQPILMAVVKVTVRKRSSEYSDLQDMRKWDNKIELCEEALWNFTNRKWIRETLQ